MQHHCTVLRSVGAHRMSAGKMAQTTRLANLAVADRSMICNTDVVEAPWLDNLIGEAGGGSFRPVPHRRPRWAQLSLMIPALRHPADRGPRRYGQWQDATQRSVGISRD